MSVYSAKCEKLLLKKMSFHKLFKFVLTIVLVLPNFVGNTLVCLVVKKDKSYHTFVNFLLVHLAVTDIFVGISGFIEVLIEVFVPDKSTINTVFCKLFSNDTLVLLGAFTTALNIIMIAVHKYLGIVKPLRSMQYGDVRHLKFVIPLTWVISLTSLIPRLRKTFSSPGCGELDSRNPVGNVNFLGNVLGFLLGFVIPVGILGYLVWKIARVLQKRWKPLKMNSSGKDSMMKSRRKVIRRLGYVIVVFCLSVLPYQIVFLVNGVLNLEESIWSGIAIDLSECVFIAGSSINPFLYWISNQKFRRTVLKLWGKSNRVTPMGMRQQNSSNNNTQGSNRTTNTNTNN